MTSELELVFSRPISHTIKFSETFHQKGFWNLTQSHWWILTNNYQYMNYDDFFEVSRFGEQYSKIVNFSVKFADYMNNIHQYGVELYYDKVFASWTPGIKGMTSTGKNWSILGNKGIFMGIENILVSNEISNIMRTYQ